MPSVRPKELLEKARAAEKSGNQKEAAICFANLSIVLRKAKRPKDAKKFINKAIQLAPESVRLYAYLAMAEADIGDDFAAKNAIETYAKLAIKKNKVREYSEFIESKLSKHPRIRLWLYDVFADIDRTDGVIFLVKAKAYVELEDWNNALISLIDALKMKDCETEAIEVLIEVLNKSDSQRGLEALDSYCAERIGLEELITLLQSPSEEVRSKVVEVSSLEVPEKEKDLGELIRELEDSLGISLEDRPDKIGPLVAEFRRRSNKVIGPDDKTRVDMALAFYEMGLIDDARDELRQVGEMSPKHLDALLLDAEILFSQGSELESLEVLQRVLRDERCSIEQAREANYKLVQVYFRLGDFKRALDYVKQIELKFPNYRGIRDIKRQIRESLDQLS